MAVKNTAQVIIGGKIITLGGYESEEYFQQVASYMNKKIGELETVPGYGRQPMETKHMLLSLNITDDYFKAKKQVETYELDLQQKDQEMYDLKHELISLRMQIEEAQKNEQEALDEKNLLEGKVKELEKELSKVEFSGLKIPYVTNVTAQCVTDISETKDLLARQISSSVLWQQSVEKMIQEGVDTFVEIGPGKTLAGFMKKIAPEMKTYNIQNVEDLEQISDLIHSRK